MHLNLFWIFTLSWTGIKCEPPVESYLPPGGNNGRPSPVYGPSRENSGPLNLNRPNSGKSPNIPQDSYFPPGQPASSSVPDTQYGPPGRGSDSQQRNPQFGSQSPNDFSQRRNPPSSQYGAPEAGNKAGSTRQAAGLTPFGGNSGPQSTYDAPNQGFGNTQSRSGIEFQGAKSRQGQRPESSYGPPPTGAIQDLNEQGSGGQSARGTPSSSYLSPASGNLRDGGFDRPQSSGNVPSSSYGTPEFGGSGSGGNFGRGSDFGGEDSDEPAKYEFSYDVDDAQTGTKFHHSEQRDGDVTTGEYDVELPDGRKQVVEYESGLQGFKPQIRYEGGSNSGRPSFNSGNSRSQGAQGRGQTYSQGAEGYPESSSNRGVDTFSEGDNNIGYPQAQGQDVRSNRLQELNDFNQGYSQNTEKFTGYPKGGPQGGNGQNAGVFSNNLPGKPQNGRSQGYPEANGAKYNDEQNEEGYPSGRPQGGRGRPQGNIGRPQGGANYPRGNRPSFGGQEGPMYPSSANQGTGSRSNDGYPSGVPNGPRGSGY